jgi:hypothetical protein
MPPHRSLSAIAAEITADWTARHEYAQPYMDALSELHSATDPWRLGTGSNAIQGFLINAQTWRGPVARRVKDELRTILHDFPMS